MVDHDNLSGSEELLRDDNGSDGLDGTASRVPNHVGITLYKPQCLCRINPGVHTCDDSYLAKHQTRQRRSISAHAPGKSLMWVSPFDA